MKPNVINLISSSFISRKCILAFAHKTRSLLYLFVTDIYGWNEIILDFRNKMYAICKSVLRRRKKIGGRTIRYSAGCITFVGKCWAFGYHVVYSPFFPCRANICRSHLLLSCNHFFRPDLLEYGNLIRKQCLFLRRDWLFTILRNVGDGQLRLTICRASKF